MQLKLATMAKLEAELTGRNSEVCRSRYGRSDKLWPLFIEKALLEVQQHLITKVVSLFPLISHCAINGTFLLFYFEFAKGNLPHLPSQSRL